jgi:hypothetical protein
VLEQTSLVPIASRRSGNLRASALLAAAEARSRSPTHGFAGWGSSGSRKAEVGRRAERLFGAEERSALQVAPSA